MASSASNRNNGPFVLFDFKQITAPTTSPVLNRGKWPNNTLWLLLRPSDVEAATRSLLSEQHVPHEYATTSCVLFESGASLILNFTSLQVCFLCCSGLTSVWTICPGKWWLYACDLKWAKMVYRLVVGPWVVRYSYNVNTSVFSPDISITIALWVRWKHLWSKSMWKVYFLRFYWQPSTKSAIKKSYHYVVLHSCFNNK